MCLGGQHEPTLTRVFLCQSSTSMWGTPESSRASSLGVNTCKHFWGSTCTMPHNKHTCIITLSTHTHTRSHTHNPHTHTSYTHLILHHKSHAHIPGPATLINFVTICMETWKVDSINTSLKADLNLHAQLAWLQWTVLFTASCWH